MARYFGVPLRNGLPIGLGSSIAIRGAGTLPYLGPATVEYLVVAGGGGGGAGGGALAGVKGGGGAGGFRTSTGLAVIGGST